MSQYDVYGLGNALVDYEYEVSAEWLQEMGIDKGVMTLMDEEQQARIVAAIDHDPVKKASGGSGANSVIALAQMGGKGFYTCRVAADDDGVFYAGDMVECGVETNLKDLDSAEGITGKCLVFATPDADRTMSTFLGITGELSQSELNLNALENSSWLYLEGYTVTTDTAKAAAVFARQHAEAHQVKTALSLSDPNMVAFFKEGLLEMLGEGVDLLFANEEEAKGMAGSDDMQEVYAYLKTISRSFAVTLGGEGSMVFDGERMIEIAPFKTEVVDTLGAGDMYAGAFLYGLSQGWDYAKSGQLASMASAKMVARFGPRFETAETRAILAEFENAAG